LKSDLLAGPFLRCVTEFVIRFEEPDAVQ